MKKKVILLNPPGEKKYIRDYYCSKVSKAWYVYPPVDLLMLSGILYGQFEIKVIDAIVENLSVEECLREIKEFSPHAVIFITGAVSKREDFEFVKKIKGLGDILTIASGDFLLEDGEPFLKNELALDAILRDFTSNDILVYLMVQESIKHFPIPLRKSPKVIAEGDFLDREGFSSSAIISRGHGEISKEDHHRSNGEFRIPIPRHELFLNKKYSYPFIKRYPFSVVLTDYGCPFKCPFCVMPNVGYKYRPVDNVLEEVSYLNHLGINEIYFADQTFGANRSRTLQLCRQLAKSFTKLGWVCFSRADTTDEELLTAMKDSGCHTIIYGIESGNDEILKRFKGIKKERIRETISLCKKHKIRVVGTFMIGLPGETEESIRDTINFSKECDFDYLSFNIAIPRANTGLRQEAIQKKLWLFGRDEMDQSGTYAVMGTGSLSKDEVFKWHKKAVKEFYLRPGYLLGRLLSIKSWQEFKINLQEGSSLLKGILAS